MTVENRLCKTALALALLTSPRAILDSATVIAQR